MEKVNAKDYLGHEVTVKIDRQLGSKHPKWGFVYSLNHSILNHNLTIV